MKEYCDLGTAKRLAEVPGIPKGYFYWYQVKGIDGWDIALKREIKGNKNCINKVLTYSIAHLLDWLPAGLVIGKSENEWYVKNNFIFDVYRNRFIQIELIDALAETVLYLLNHDWELQQGKLGKKEVN